MALLHGPGRARRAAGASRIAGADRAAEREGPLRDAFERLAGPEKVRLEAELPKAKELADELHGRYAGHVHYTVAHPEALRRLDLLDHRIDAAAYELDVERQGLDGVVAQPPRPEGPKRGIEQNLDIEHGVDFEIGL